MMLEIMYKCKHWCEINRVRLQMLKDKILNLRFLDKNNYEQHSQLSAMQNNIILST